MHHEQGDLSRLGDHVEAKGQHSPKDASEDLAMDQRIAAQEIHERDRDEKPPGPARDSVRPSLYVHRTPLISFATCLWSFTP